VRAKLVVLAALAALALPAEPAAARKPSADLVVSDVRATRYAFQGEPASHITFCERTTNRGGAATGRRLHNVMVLVGSGAQEIVAKRDVPKLAGSSRRRGHVVHHSHFGCGKGESTPLNVPLGMYEIQICADLKLKAEPNRARSNNCQINSKAFAVIKRSWTGTGSGFATDLFPDGNGKISWQAASVTYTFSQYDPNTGQVLYKPAGSVNYQLAGTTGGGCTAAGGVTLGTSGGELKLDYKSENYKISAEVPPGSTAPVVYTCPGASATQPTPVSAYRYITNGFDVGFTNPLPFGYTSISGIYQLSHSGSLSFESQWALH
jgi:hypothetical protein